MNTPAPDDLHLMVLLWQEPRTRAVALELADKNREASKPALATERKAA